MELRQFPNKNKGMIQIENPLKEAEEMQSFLETTTSEDANELVPRLSELNVVMARSGKLLADAIELQDKVTALIFKENTDYIRMLSATIASKFISSQAAEINGLVKWLDRINATAKHQGDNIRTQISYAKEELRLVKNGY